MSLKDKNSFQKQGENAIFIPSRIINIINIQSRVQIQLTDCVIFSFIIYLSQDPDKVSPYHSSFFTSRVLLHLLIISPARHLKKSGLFVMLSFLQYQSDQLQHTVACNVLSCLLPLTDGYTGPCSIRGQQHLTGAASMCGPAVPLCVMLAAASMVPVPTCSLEIAEWWQSASVVSYLLVGILL